MKQWGTNGTVHPDDLPHIVPVFTQAIAAGDPYDFEARIRRFDGVYHWFQVRGLPLRDMGSHISRWYVLLTDIDDLKRTGDALRKSEREFRLLVETIPALVWRGTPEGELDYLNARAVEYLGFTAESLTGGRWLELVHPDHRDAVVGRWVQSATTGSSYEDIYRLRRADGHYRWIQSVGEPFYDGEGRIAHWYGLVIDIEDRKRVEDDLRRSEAFLVEGQHLARIGNFSWQIEAEEITWSEQIYRMFEFEPGTRMTLELMGTRVHPEDIPMLRDMVERARRGVSDFEYEHRLLMPDQSIKYLHLIAHRARDEQGCLEYIGAVQDVTERKVAEDALNKARAELAHVARVTTLSALTASIAHEVNQPLSGIITNAGTCLRMLDAAPPNIDGARETARRTIRDGNRAADVVARLRALFTKKEFTLEPLDLNDAIREVMTLSTSDFQRHRVIVQSDLADNLPMVTGDRIQLQQVILNLLRNASDAMQGVNDRPRHMLIATQRDAGDRVRLTVRDAGVGLNPDAMDKLFDAFYTTKSDGMGIGLSISRSIIERHQGRLWAEPNDGHGATFSFSIPHDADVVRGVR
jgi:PAS domain S-box-containing protein